MIHVVTNKYTSVYFITLYILFYPVLYTTGLQSLHDRTNYMYMLFTSLIFSFCC